MNIYRSTLIMITLLASPLAATQEEIADGSLSGVVDYESLVVYTLPCEGCNEGAILEYVVEFEDWIFKFQVLGVKRQGCLEYCSTQNFQAFRGGFNATSPELTNSGTTSFPRYVVRDGFEYLEITLYDATKGVMLVDGAYRYCVLSIPLFKDSDGEWLGDHQYMLVR